MASHNQTINETSAFQYILLNGPTGLYTGFNLANDFQADHILEQFDQLIGAISAILVMQCLVVDTVAVAYCCWFLLKINDQQARLWLTFMRLPSALLSRISEKKKVSRHLWCMQISQSSHW